MIYIYIWSLIYLIFGQPVGTYGYAAPEYIETGHLKAESDIWSFGIVLYEILTGRRVVEKNRPTTEQKLLDWVKQFPHNGNKFYMIIDPRIKNQYSLSSARKIAELADSCLSKNPKDRPKMSEVVKKLEQVVQELEWERIFLLSFNTRKRWSIWAFKR